MANNDEYTDEYTDEYNDEYLCRDFFVGVNFWSRLSFQISEFRVHCSNYKYCVNTRVNTISFYCYVFTGKVIASSIETIRQRTRMTSHSTSRIGYTGLKNSPLLQIFVKKLTCI